jgi:anthranilate phosphoribosyltransferase
MSISHYIKEIGRGKEGARALTQEQAQDLMTQVLEGQVTDLELGAFAIAMRIKGESVPELAGFLAATQTRCIALQTQQPAVLLPSYNGARKLPNLTPLLAGLLAQQGVPVLVHGLPDDPTRVTSAQIFQTLGWPVATDTHSVEQAWAHNQPAYIETQLLCPPLARLLHVRWVIGLRNPAHTVAKLLDPFSAHTALRVVNHTHPEYGQMLTEFLQHTQANAVLMRGTEGEPVADPRRMPQLNVFINGQARPDLSVSAQTGVLRELPALPSQCDAHTTARYIETIMQGSAAAPASLTEQVRCLMGSRQALQTTRVKS